MKIEAGRAITEAMVKQREHDVLRLVITERWPKTAFLGNVPIMPHTGGTLDLGLDDQLKRPS